MYYRTKDVAAFYDVSDQTVGVWSREFAQYLSPHANPGRKKKRLFTKEDMSVFSLVSQLQGHGMTFEEIHANLKSGARGEEPHVEPTEVQALISTETESRLAVENDRLTRALVSAQEALKKAEIELAKLREVEDQNIRLETKLEVEQASKQEYIQQQNALRQQLLEQHEAQRKELQSQIEAMQQKLTEFALKAGQEYSRGFIEGLREQNRQQKEDGSLQ